MYCLNKYVKIIFYPCTNSKVAEVDKVLTGKSVLMERPWIVELLFVMSVIGPGSDWSVIVIMVAIFLPWISLANVLLFLATSKFKAFIKFWQKSKFDLILVSFLFLKNFF